MGKLECLDLIMDNKYGKLIMLINQESQLFVFHLILNSFVVEVVKEMLEYGK